jgi:hypothetical protein
MAMVTRLPWRLRVRDAGRSPRVMSGNIRMLCQGFRHGLESVVKRMCLYELYPSNFYLAFTLSLTSLEAIF